MAEKEQPVYYHHDILYGAIELPPQVLALLNVSEFVRLSRVSLDAVPPWLQSTSICDSKLSHSIGVAHLARTLARARVAFAPYEDMLVLSSALHDIATPPFSHISDRFLYAKKGVDHETLALEVILNSPDLIQVIRQFGQDPQQVAALIAGRLPPLSDVINGSIDLDNSDNSLRYGASKGLLEGLLYKPENIARCFDLVDDRVVLVDAQDDIERWQECRERVYRYVYSQDNLKAEIMIQRAMELLFLDGLLPERFFFLTDDQAFEFLIGHQDAAVASLMKDVYYRRFYDLAFGLQTTSPSEQLEQLTGDLTRGMLFADQIANRFGISPHYVGVVANRDKGYRNIHLPIQSSDGSKRQHQPQPVGHLVRVFIHPSLLVRKDEIASFCQELVGYG